MIKKKPLSDDALEKVSGGTFFNSPQEVTHKYGRGTHVELIWAEGLFTGHAYTYSSSITDLGVFLVNRGINTYAPFYKPCYYVKTDSPEHDADSGWYEEDKFNNDYKVNPMITGL